MSKILYAASSLSHIDNFHRGYIRALSDMGHDVRVMARGDGADFNIPFEKKFFSKKNTECRRMIKEIIKREKFDVILLNTTLAAFHIRLACRGKSRPRIVNLVHGYLFSKNTGFLKRTVLLFCEAILKGRTDAIMVMNSEDYGIANKHKLTNGKVYFTKGMGIKLRPQISSKEEVRARMKDNDSFVMTFVGELSTRKNQEFLIRALSEIRKDIKNAVLWLVGEGAERSRLEELARELSIADAVRFVGYTSEACDYMRASDVYVSAAVSEGLPFNIIEAASAKLPILASRVKGQDDVISDGESGYLYQLGDLSEFKEKILKIHSGELSLSPDKIYQSYQKYSEENVFADTLSLMLEAMNL